MVIGFAIDSSTIYVFADDLCTLAATLRMCIYWTHEWLIFWSDCTLHFVVIRFFKEALMFIDIISLIPRPCSPSVAVLQASLVWTWEWDYKFMYTRQPVWAKACVGLINLQLSHKDALAKGQIYTQLVSYPDPGLLESGLDYPSINTEVTA